MCQFYLWNRLAFLRLLDGARLGFFFFRVFLMLQCNNRLRGNRFLHSLLSSFFFRFIALSRFCISRFSFIWSPSIFSLCPWLGLWGERFVSVLQCDLSLRFSPLEVKVSLDESFLSFVFDSRSCIYESRILSSRISYIESTSRVQELRKFESVSSKVFRRVLVSLVLIQLLHNCRTE